MILHYAAAAAELSITSERNTVVTPPGGPATRSSLGVQVSLALKTAVLLTSCSKSTKLAVLVNWVADPVNSRVVTNDSVGWVYKNHLKVLVHGILVHPVGVEHAESAAFTSNTLFSQTAKVSDWLELRDTLVDWLTIHNTLRKETSNG